MNLTVVAAQNSTQGPVAARKGGDDGKLPIPTGPPKYGPVPTVKNFQALADSLIEKLNVPMGCIVNPLAANGNSQNLAAVWLREAFHDAGTFKKNDRRLPGGADASVMSLLIGGNKGLDNFAPQFVEAALKAGASNADIIQLAGVISIKHCGGPNIPFVGGRRDNLTPHPLVVDRLPGRKEKYASIKAKFASQGLTPQEMVALVTGGHSMGGRGNKFFDETPGVFDNLVFKRALQGKCVIDIDCEIAQDRKLRPLVQKFADNQTAFFEAFKVAYSKMMRQTPFKLSAQGQLLNIPEHPNVQTEGVLANAKPPKDEENEDETEDEDDD